MDAETRSFLENHFNALQQELKRTNVRPAPVENPAAGVEYRPDAVEDLFAALEDRCSGLEQRIGILEDRAGRQERTFESLRTEMRDRFISAAEQVRTLTLRLQYLQTRVDHSVAAVSRDLSGIRDEVSSLTFRTSRRDAERFQKALEASRQEQGREFTR